MKPLRLLVLLPLLLSAETLGAREDDSRWLGVSDIAALSLGIAFDFDSETVTLTVRTPPDRTRVLLDIDVFTG